MSIERDVKKKLETLFKEQEKTDDFNEILFNEDTKTSFEDFTEEEKREVADAVRKMYDARAPQSIKKWKWNYSGRLILKALLYLVEFVIWVSLIYLVLPFTINKDVTIVQSLCGTIILSYFRFWWK